MPIEKALDLMRGAKHMVALTGAGISTPSGIPDFRSPGSGLWDRYDPMEVASLASFRYHPEQFYRWFRDLAHLIFHAQPNPAHLALARLEQAGLLTGVISQNVDGLHHSAGSKKVYEIHGHLREFTCGSCYQTHPAQAFIQDYIEFDQLPYCHQCGHILKPNVVLFGEQLPVEVNRRAKDLVLASDLVLVIGSSLEVAPAAMLPVEAVNAGAQLIIINQTPTFLDARADVVFHSNAADILPKLVDEVLSD